MDSRCVEAISNAALKMVDRRGNKIKFNQKDLAGIEKRIIDERKQLAQEQDKAAKSNPNFQRMTDAEFKDALSDRIVSGIQAQRAKAAQRENLNLIAVAKNEAYVQSSTAQGRSALADMRRSLSFIADGQGNVISAETMAKRRSMGFLFELSPLLELEEGLIHSVLGNPEGVAKVIDEFHGIDTKDSTAKTAAQAIKNTMNKIADRYNELGGSIGKLKDWLPQKQDFMRVYKAGMEKWTADAFQHIDRSTLRDTSGNLLDDAKTMEFLREAWKTNAYDGELKTSMQRESISTIANRHKQHRELHWKDGEAYKYMMTNYGAGNLIEQVKSTVMAMSREIVMMEQFGPSAIQNMSLMFDNAKEADSARGMFSDKKTSKQASVDLDMVGKLIKSYSGVNDGIGGGYYGHAIHNFFRGVSNITVANSLGSLPIAQFADNGIAVAVLRSLDAPIAQWGIHKAEFYSPAVRERTLKVMGINFEHTINSVSRWSDGASTAGVTGKLASTTMKITGANDLTAIHRNAFSSYLLSYLGEMSHKTEWGSVDPHSKMVLESKGFTETDWNVLRAAKFDSADGTMLSSKHLADIPDAEILPFIKDKIDAIQGISEAQKQIKIDMLIEEIKTTALDKLMGYAIEETELGVLQSGLDTQLKTNLYKRGEIVGEIGNAVLQFKKFPMAYINQVFLQRGKMAKNRVQYSLELLAYTTMLGGVALMLQDLAMGKDPRTIFDEDRPAGSLSKFGIEAMLKGGGMGIFGDLLQIDWEGRDPVEKMSGPTAAKMVGVMKLGTELFQAARGDDNTQVAKRALDAGKQFVPFQNLWYARAAYNNYLMSALYEYASPGYQDRMEGFTNKNYGNGYYLGMGQDARLPTFSNVIK